MTEFHMIDLTYEEYAKKFSVHFCNTIKITFFDDEEPNWETLRQLLSEIQPNVVFADGPPLIEMG